MPTGRVRGDYIDVGVTPIVKGGSQHLQNNREKTIEHTTDNSSYISYANVHGFKFVHTIITKSFTVSERKPDKFTYRCVEQQVKVCY